MSKKKTFIITSFLNSALILSLASIAISCGSNNLDNNNEIVDPNLSQWINNNVVDNDYLSQETGVNLFDLNVFEGKTLDEIDFNLILTAMIPQDSSNVKRLIINQHIPLIKNKELNFFSFSYNLVLANNEYDYIDMNSWMTIYLPLQVDSKEILDVNSFKELAAKATSEQYLNSFKETQLENNDMFQNVFYLEGIAFWKSLISQWEEPFIYKQSDFVCDLDNDEILKYTISTSTTTEFEHYREFSLKVLNVSANKYEKITINNNIYLRITLGKGAVELYDKTNSKSYINTHESSFYIDITNWDISY